VNRDLTRFLAGREAQATDSVTWNGRTMFRIDAYLDDRPPPLDYVTSVRGLVFRGESLLVVRNENGLHIWPGGRRERGETQEETLRRELLEETGWAVRDPIQLGFVLFHHLTPVPAAYAYPYPDFVHVMYVAEADVFLPEAKLEDDFELESAFRMLAEVQSLPLTAGEKFFLEAAVKLRLLLSS
jgi:8-oxo-dGTP pyrophosphatase MutT (NUDIX family)